MALRPATEADLADIYSVWYETEVEGVDDPPQPAPNLWFAHVLRRGQLLVATDRSGRIVGFAGACREGPLTVLTDCFVRPAAQSTGIGSALLDAIVPRSGPVATFASSDPRAVAGYARRRMTPRWPAYYLIASRERLGFLESELAVRPAGAEALRFLVEARTEPEYWSGLGATYLEMRDRGQDQIVGAAMVTAKSPFRLFEPDGATVTESSAIAGQATGTVIAAVAWCLGTGSPSVGLQVPGSHEALPRLLEHGFRITDVDIACASDAQLLADPTRTTFFGEPLPPWELAEPSA